MNGSDILTIAACLALGYAVVHLFLRKPSPPAAQEPPPYRAPSPRAVASPHWSSVLEVPRDAGVDDIRDAYRRLMSQYHPDKVASLGRELRELAESKTKDIAIAYEQALAERGAAG